MTLNSVNPVQTTNVENSNLVDESELGSIFDLVLENRRMIVTVTAICLLLGGLYALLRPRVYQGNLLIQVEDSVDSAANSLLGNVSSLFDVKSTTDAEIELIRSRLVIARAVDSTKLFIYAKPRYLPLLGLRIASRNKKLSKPGIFGIGGFCWGAESIDVSQFDVPSDDEGDKFKITALEKGRYMLSGSDLERPVIGFVGKLLTFQTDLGEATLLVDNIAGNAGAEFNLVRNSRLKTIESIQEKLKLQELGKQSGVISVMWEDQNASLVSDVMNAIGREYVKQNVDRKSEEAQRSLEFLNGQLPQMKADLEQSENRFNEMRNKLGTVNLGDESGLILQQSVDVETQLMGLRQKREELMTRFGPLHPALRAISDQIEVLMRQRGAIEARLKSRPMVEQSILRLSRDVQVNQALYIATLNNVQQLKLLKAGRVGTVRLVDPSVVPEEPVKPKPWIDLGLSLIFGLTLSGALMFVRNALFSGVKDPAELEKRTGLTVYSVLPMSTRQVALKRTTRVMRSTGRALSLVCPQDPAVESLRSLRIAMQFTMLDTTSNVVVFTGPSPRIGKSFVSLNFAVVLATAGQRVLLVDGDLRKGYLHQDLDKRRENGLSDLLAGRNTLAEVLQTDVVPHLDFISTGTLPPNPNEVLLSPRLPQLLAQFRDTYDVVVIDTPPILVAADASVIAQNAATVYLVVKAGVTNVAEVNESAKRLGQAGVVTKGIVFNGVQAHLGKYGYGAKYGVYKYAAYSYADQNES